jgi:hypothetical protein
VTARPVANDSGQDGDSDPEEVMGEFLGRDLDQEGLWENVKTNVQARKLRLIFVADVIPPELRRIVEFLNEQMNRTEVLAVEIKQYVKDDLKTLVRRVIGQTADAERNRPRPAARWDQGRFFAALQETCSGDEVALAENLLAFGTEVSGRGVDWGTGRDRGSFTPRLIIGNDRFSLFSVYTNAQISLNIGWNSERLSKIKAELSEKYRSEARSRLHVDFDRAKWQGGWMLKLAELLPSNAEAFKELVRDSAGEIGELLATKQN